MSEQKPQDLPDMPDSGAANNCANKQLGNLDKSLQEFTDLVHSHICDLSNLRKKSVRCAVGGLLMYALGVSGFFAGQYLNPHKDSAKVYVEAKEKLRNLNYSRNNYNNISLNLSLAQSEYKNDAVSNLELQILDDNSQVMSDLDSAITLVKKDVEALAQLPQIKSYDEFNDWTLKLGLGVGLFGIIVGLGSAIFYSVKSDNLTRKYELQRDGMCDSLIEA